jgi:predicted NBD/HSP70 family sugar kinase
LVVRPESERVYVLAFSIEVDRVTAARVGLGGIVLERHEAPRAPGMIPPEEVVLPLTEFAQQMRRSAPDQARHIGSGVAVSAVVRQRDGNVRLWGYGKWPEDRLAAALATSLGAHEARAGAPGKGESASGTQPALAVGSTADLAALAEHTRGVATNCRNMIYLHQDAGISGGVIAAGRQLTGHAGSGGEVGHMIVNPAGKLCGCGARGCWETEIGEYRLLSLANRAPGTGHAGIVAIVDAAARGDVIAQTAMRQVGDWLGFGVANLVNIFNPEMVVFGGTLREVYLAAAAQVRSRINRNSLSSYREHVRLRTCGLGSDAPLIGAAELAFERLLADPLDGAGD